MPSPFPGMDPYLERHWGDVHHRFITYASDQLQAALPKPLVARVEERVFVESAPATRRHVVPDVRIVERRRGKRNGTRTNGAVTVAEPLIIALDEPVTQGFIEIRDAASGNRVVTVVEVLSLANKVPGLGQTLYRQKQQELLEGRVSLVEIDLLRAGERLLPFPAEELPASHRTPYQAVVRRGWHATSVEVYAVPLRAPLPAIKIPLREADADVPLDLQVLIELCYRNGSYESDIDYRADPDPPLVGSDARWAAALLRKKGLRGPRRSPRR
jgi:hypothetical protein